MADPCRIFHDKMDQLYGLAYVLTADPDKAKQCYVNGLACCLESNHVFQEWVESWTRRVIIKNAIRLMMPADAEYPKAVEEQENNQLLADRSASALLRLDVLARFVFVMSVLEQYSVQECAILLSCCPSQVIEAKARALGFIGRVVPDTTRFEIAMNSNNQSQGWRNL